jgi:hypothetical protein
MRWPGKSVRRFGGSEHGNVAVIFAAVLVPVIGVAAAALDYGRASKARDQLQRASQVAAEAASVDLMRDRDRIAGLVRTHLDANLPEELRHVPFGMAIASDRRSIEITMEASIPASLMAIVGVPKIDVAASGFARTPVPRLPDAPAAEAVARAPDAPSAFRDLWRSLFGGPAPSPEAMRDAEEMAKRAIRDLPRLPEPPPVALPKGLPDVGPIRNGEDLRRAARAIGEQIRDLPQVGHGAPPPDLERLMREMQRRR